MTHYETELPLSTGWDGPLRVFATDFTTAFKPLGPADKDATFETGRQLREAFCSLNSNTVTPVRDGGVPRLARHETSHALVDVGYSLEAALQEEGAVTVHLSKRSDRLCATVDDGLANHQSVEFDAAEDQSELAQRVAVALAEYLPPNDRTDPTWNGTLFGGLTISIKRRHDCVRVASNAFGPDFDEPSPRRLARVRGWVGRLVR
jgi:hypothetical protein